MSEQLLKFVIAFVNDEFDSEYFSDQYIINWRNERDSGLILKDDAALSEALSTIFCMADNFNPEPNREEYEFDGLKLKNEIQITLRNANFI